MNVGVDSCVQPVASAGCCKDETVTISGAGCTALPTAPHNAGMRLRTAWNCRCEVALSS
jgi:hypothetical protein